MDLGLKGRVAIVTGASSGLGRAAAARFAREGASVVTSLSAKQPTPSLLLSSVARAGVRAFTKCLAIELAEEGITVNAVCPGYTLTDRLSELAEAEAGRRKIDPRDIYDLWVKEIPAKRLAEPTEFADVVAFLASEPASYVTGVALAIDGGYIKSLI